MVRLPVFEVPDEERHSTGLEDSRKLFHRTVVVGMRPVKCLVSVSYRKYDRVLSYLCNDDDVSRPIAFVRLSKRPGVAGDSRILDLLEKH